MGAIYCDICKTITPYKGLIKKAVCPCGNKNLKAVAGRWSDKIGWDYFDRSGGFVGFLPADSSTVPIEVPEIKKIVKQLNLDL